MVHQFSTLYKIVLIFSFIAINVIYSNNTPCNFLYEKGQSFSPQEIESNNFFVSTSNVLDERAYKEVYENLIACKNSIEFNLNELGELLNNIFASKISLLDNSQIINDLMVMNNLDKEKNEIIEAAIKRLSQISIYGIYGSLIKAPFNEDTSSLISSSKILISPKAIEDLRGVAIESITEFSNHQIKQKAISQKFSGSARVKNTLYEKRFFHDDSTYLLYIAEVEARPLDDNGLSSYYTENLVGAVSNLDTFEKIDNFILNKFPFLNDDSKNIFLNEFKNIPVDYFNSWQNSIRMANSKAKKKNQKIIRDLVSHIERKESEIEEISKRVYLKREGLSELFNNLNFNCNSELYPETCIENASTFLDVIETDILKHFWDLKNLDPVWREINVDAQSNPSRDIKFNLENIYKNIYSSHANSVDLYKEIKVLNSEIVQSETLLKLRVYRTPEKITLLPFISKDGNLSFLLLLNFTYRNGNNEPNELIARDTEPLKILSNNKSDDSMDIFPTEDKISKNLLSQRTAKAPNAHSERYGNADYFIRINHDNIEKILISPDSSMIVTLGSMTKAKAWGARDGKLLFETTGHMSNGGEGTFSIDGNFFCTTASDNMTIVWKSSNGSHHFSINDSQNCDFSNDNAYLKVIKNGRVILYDTITGDMIKTINSTSIVLNAVFSRTSDQILISTSTGIEIIDLNTFAKIHKNMWADRLKVANDGTSLMLVNFNKKSYSGGSLYNIFITNIFEDSFYTLPGVFNLSSNSANFSPAGNKILAIDHNNTASLFNTSDGSHIASLQRGHLGPLYQADFTPRGSFIFTSGYDGKVIFRDSNGKSLTNINNELNHEFLNSKEIVPFAVNISPDERFIVTFNPYHNNARVWDLEALQKKQWNQF